MSISSCEAELYAASLCAVVIVWMRRLLKSVGTVCKQPTEVHEDNAGTIQMINEPSNNTRAKHVDIRNEFVTQQVKDGVINMVKIATEDNSADLLTKVLSKEAHVKHTRRVLGHV